MSEDRKKTAWEQYKENLGSTRPWDFIDPKTEYVSEDISQQRYSICLQCPEFFKVTKQCKKCGCLMTLKTKLKNAECPIQKW